MLSITKLALGLLVVAAAAYGDSGQMDRRNGECKEDYFTRVASDDFKAKAAAKPLLKAEAKQLIVKAKRMFRDLKATFRIARKTLRGFKKSKTKPTPLQTANPTPLQTANPTPLPTAIPTPLQADGTFGGILGSYDYTFKVVELPSTSGNQNDLMKAECTKVGMKPVCEAYHLCKDDRDDTLLIVGQTNHLTLKDHRENDDYFPSGWSTLKDEFPSSFCAYTGLHGRGESTEDKTICTSDSNYNMWFSLGEMSKQGGVLCGKSTLVNKDGLPDETNYYDPSCFMSSVRRGGVCQPGDTSSAGTPV